MVPTPSVELDQPVSQTQSQMQAQVQVPRSPNQDSALSTQLSNPIIARTPSPLPALTSPPPTTKQDRDSLLEMAAISDVPSLEHISKASVEELRQLVSGLSISLKESRTSAAHYNLQHNMLMIESSKARNALAVEIEMLQRELEVLQDSSSSAPRQSLEAAANRDLINDLNKQITILNNEIQRQQIVVGQLQRGVDQRNDRIALLEEHNEKLRHRIRTNREHMNGIIDSVRDRSPLSAMNTPSRSYYNTPKGHVSTPGRRADRRDTNNMAFDVLLLADKVISQETATAPSTPKSHHKRGHNRGALSLSSLPTTPTRRPLTTLQTPVHLSQPLHNEAPATAPQFRYSAPRVSVIPEIPSAAVFEHHQRRRRASTESTISIPDRNANEPPQFPVHGAHISHLTQASLTDDDELVPESSASQAATSMLRGPSAATPKRGRASGALKQTKISQHARVVKPASAMSDAFGSPEKRRLASGAVGPQSLERSQGSSGGVQASPKKRRVDASVGLGIGL